VPQWTDQGTNAWLVERQLGTRVRAAVSGKDGLGPLPSTVPDFQRRPENAASQGAVGVLPPSLVSSPRAAASLAAVAAGACSGVVSPAKLVGPACQSPARVAAVPGVGAASASGPGPPKAHLL
jgi:hypothetical protein